MYQIYFWNRNLHVPDSFSVHHQVSSTTHTAIGIGHTGYAACLLANCCSILILHDIYHCHVYSARLLMMDRKNARNM